MARDTTEKVMYLPGSKSPSRAEEDARNAGATDVHAEYVKIPNKGSTPGSTKYIRVVLTSTQEVYDRLYRQLGAVEIS